MDITPLVRKDQQIVQSYAGGRFKISGRAYETPVVVFTSETREWPVTASLKEMSANDFEAMTEVADEIDVLLLGTGSRMEFLPPKLRQELRDKGLVIDVMDTGAACRTYNVLMAEGRRVAAALMLSD